MALTHQQHPLYDAIEEAKKRQADYAASTLQATQAGVGALEKMQELGRQKKLDEEKTAQQAAENKREDQRLGLQLSREARDTSNDDETRARTDAADQQKKIDARINAAVTASRTTGESPQDLSSRLHDEELTHDVGSSSVIAEFARQKQAEDLKNREIGVKETTAEAAKTKANRTPGPPSPEAANRQKMKDDLLAAKLENEKNKSGDNLTTATRTDTEKKKIAVGLVKSRGAALRHALADPMLAGYTGPLSGLENHILTTFGRQNPKAIHIASLVGQYFDEYKHAITGAAASDKEMVSLETRAPKIDDTVGAMIAKLDAVDEISDRQSAYYDSVLAPAQSATSSGASDTVVVTNGKETLQIPRARLKEAQADGFKEAGR